MKHENKSRWGEGPWQHEPDDLEWVDEATGLDCKISRGPFGALCGYVAVPQGHPTWGKAYDPIEYVSDENIEWWRRHVTQRLEYKISDIRIHGGLTYANADEMGRWWFGFDCSHGFDQCPGIDYRTHMTPVRASTEYRDWAYVRGMVQLLAKQLAAIKKEDL